MNVIKSKSKRGDFVEFYRDDLIELCFRNCTQLFKNSGVLYDDCCNGFLSLKSQYRKNRCCKCGRIRRLRITFVKRIPFMLFEQFPNYANKKWLCDKCTDIMTESLEDNSVKFFTSLQIALQLNKE